MVQSDNSAVRTEPHSTARDGTDERILVRMEAERRSGRREEEIWERIDET